jgi:choice-of-anchor B domain-containing protein
MKKLMFVLFIIFVSNLQQVNAQLGHHNMQLLANLSQHQAPYSAIEAYVAPDGREYAIIGCFDGTAFIDVTDENNIHEVGFLPSTNPGNSSNVWNEFKTYSHYSYHVSEVTNSGIRIVDLQYLPDSIHYVKKYDLNGYSRAHTISQSGNFLYVNGSNIGQGVTVFDLTNDPLNPVRRGSYNADYIHDCRIVNDTIYAANINAGKVTIINAVNKDNLTLVTSFTNLPGSGPHNTALTPDRKYLLVTDEIGTAPYRLKFWNIEDLGNITFITSWHPTGITSSIVHNVEVYGNYALVGHYSAGVRLIDISNPVSPVEVAWYDTYPLNDFQNFNGCWGAQLLPSGKIIASDRSTGLYVLKTSNVFPAANTVGLMSQGMFVNSNPYWSLNDTIRFYLYRSDFPNIVVDSSKCVISDQPYIYDMIFNNAASGSYYLVVKHRNSLETWSDSPINYVRGSAFFKNFISPGASYGDNMVLLTPEENWRGLYSGDVNQDNVIDLKDILQVYNSASVFENGYVISDLTGDLLVDLNDVLITYNNSNNFVARKAPPGAG